MKRHHFITLVLTLFIVFQVNTSFSPPVGHVQVQESRLMIYTWYSDPDMMFPTGTVNTIAAEIERLRAIYPGNIFSANPYIGLIEYEYGYVNPFLTATIFSDL